MNPSCDLLLLCAALVLLSAPVAAFAPSFTTRVAPPSACVRCGKGRAIAYMSANEDEPSTSPMRKQSINERLLSEINADIPKFPVIDPASFNIEREEVDLNGVNPAMALLGAGGAGAMSFGSWKLTGFLAAAFYAQEVVQSDLLIVQRLSGLLKQVMVGLAGLGSGIFGVTALGLALLAGRVALGVVQGELDPSAPAVQVADDPESMLEDASALLERVDAELQDSYTTD